jgi:hypothetical protein
MQDRQALRFDHKNRRNIKPSSSSPTEAIKEESMTDDDMRNMGKSPDFGNPDIII